jgi:hypothetical protein
MLDQLTLSERLEAFQNALIAHATGGSACSDQEYFKLRNELMRHSLLKDVVPRVLRTCRRGSEFWAFIKTIASRSLTAAAHFCECGVLAVTDLDSSVSQ